MANSTSPHLFIEGDKKDITFIERSLKENNNVMFIRKISKDFPNDILKKYIYEYSQETDEQLVLKDPFYIKKCMIAIKEVSCVILMIGAIFFGYDIVKSFFLHFV
jgi:hypothetical protein